MNIDKLVDRFLSWPLPDSVCSDTCVTERNYGKAQRIGTNLLTADEAKQMLEYLLLGPKRYGVLHLDGYSGRSSTRVEIIGETPKRYRVRAITQTSTAGRLVYLEPGQVALVPKRAISLEQISPDSHTARGVER